MSRLYDRVRAFGCEAFRPFHLTTDEGRAELRAASRESVLAETAGKGMGEAKRQELADYARLRLPRSPPCVRVRGDYEAGPLCGPVLHGPSALLDHAAIAAPPAAARRRRQVGRGVRGGHRCGRSTARKKGVRLVRWLGPALGRVWLVGPQGALKDIGRDARRCQRDMAEDVHVALIWPGFPDDRRRPPTLRVMVVHGETLIGAERPVLGDGRQFHGLGHMAPWKATPPSAMATAGTNPGTNMNASEDKSEQEGTPVQG